MSEPTIEERVARLERHAGLPMGVKEGEARAREEWRYITDGHDGLWRLRGNYAEIWCNADVEWVTSICTPANFHDLEDHELTESEAVSRFGREILDDPKCETCGRPSEETPCPSCNGDTVCPLCGGEHRASDECPQDDETPHARALRELDLKPGDRVRVDRKVGSNTGGWNNNWIESMNEAIGCEGVISNDGGAGESFPGEGVKVRIPRMLPYRYPAHALTVVSRAGEDEREAPSDASPSGFYTCARCNLVFEITGTPTEPVYCRKCAAEPDPPKTLADVEPFTLCLSRGGAYFWRDYADNTYFALDRMNRPVSSISGPEDILVREVLGPAHVTTSDQAARVKAYSQALPDMSFPIEVANALMAIRHKLRPDARRAVIRVADYYSRQAQGGEG